MPAATIPLSDLARRLARKESEVQKLRRVYETRLTKLKDRRERLAEELRRLEAAIQAVTQETPEPFTEAAAVEEAAPSKVAGRPGKRRGTLPALIVRLLQEAGQALTVKQLAEQVQRRKFPTKSKNVARLIQARITEMMKKGVLAHASGQPGYVVRSSPNGQPNSFPEPIVGMRSPSRKSKVIKTAGRGAGRDGQPPLREVLTKILEQHKEPVGGAELAQKALKSGYKSKSKSKKFTEVVWVNLGKMKNVERVPGKGYRLKNR